VSAAGEDRQAAGNGEEAVPTAGQRLQAIQQRIKQQHAAASAVGDASYSLSATQRLVEAAMLAAVSGLSYVLATSMGFEPFLGFFLPLPGVLSSMRGGPSAGRKTVTATFFLLLVLLGPVKALTYLFTHGLMALSMGYTWCKGYGWGISIALGSLAKISGQIGFTALLSWVVQENLFRLSVIGSASSINQLRAMLGIGGSISQATVIVGIACVLLVNSVFHMFFVQIVYMILLTNMGYSVGPPPKLVRKFMMSGLR